MHKGKKDSNPTGKKSDSKKKKGGTTGTTHGAYDRHPISLKDQRLPVNTGGSLSDPEQGVHSGVPIPGGVQPGFPARDDQGNEGEDASPQQ